VRIAKRAMDIGALKIAPNHDGGDTRLPVRK
jgi:hypothetical protein